MTDDLYERYKESLRVGHVAVLRGSLEAAVDAYRTAAEIAPSRALPHSSLGGVLLRLGRLDDALVEYAAAVARAPRDEGALLGQAEALGSAGRHEEAAKALDQVAELQAESGRLPEAADTLRRAIEQHETPARAERQQDLVRQVRLSAGDHAAEQLLARALRLRDESVPRRPAVESVVAERALASTASRHAEEAEPAEHRVTDEPARELVAAGAAEAPVQAGEAAESAEVVAEPGPVEVEAEVTQAAQPAEAAPTREQEGQREVGPATLASRLRGWRGWWSEEAEEQRSDGREAAAETPAASSDSGEPVSPAAASEAVSEQAPIQEPVAQSISETEPATAFQAAPMPQPEPAAELPRPADVEPELEAQRAEAEPAAEAQPVGVMAEAQEPEQARKPSGDELLAAAEAADLDGDPARLRALLLDTARAYGAETRYEAAIDAANRVIRGAPSDLEAHLVLVELYMARDWNTLALEKLELLARLADLSGDEEGRQRVCAAASAAFPKDERFGALCS